MAKAAAATLLILAAWSAAWAQATDADGRAHAAELGPSDTSVPDFCDGVIDPYNPIDQQNRFFQASGTNGELDATEFAANQTLGLDAAPFAQKFDRWALLLAFDKDGNRRINWFEADAYRKALRQRVLAAFDTDEDGQLTGAEREAANRALAAGQTTPLPPSATRPVVPPEGATSRPASETGLSEEERRKFVAKYDTDHDGRLGEQEQQAIRGTLHEQMEARLRKYELWLHDADADGRLSSQEQRAVGAERARRREAVARQRKEWLAKYDTDRDGRISPAERRAAQKAVADRRRRELLAKYDANRDGRLDDKETARVREAGQKRAAERRRDHELRQFDKNRNGRLDEFERAVLAAFRQEDQRANREWMASYDADGDGQLNDEEHKAMQAGLWHKAETQEARTRQGPFDEDAKMDFGDEDPDATYRERLRKKYDADGDGHLNAEERARMWRELYRDALGPGDKEPPKQ